MSGVNTMHTGWWVGEKFRRKTFRLRRRCRLPFQLAGCCWNMEMAAWLVALTSRDPEYSSLRPAQIKWCITHVIPSQMIIWYNTCRNSENAFRIPTLIQRNLLQITNGWINGLQQIIGTQRVEIWGLLDGRHYKINMRFQFGERLIIIVNSRGLISVTHVLRF